MAELGRLVDLQLPMCSAIGCPNIDETYVPETQILNTQNRFRL